MEDEDPNLFWARLAFEALVAHCGRSECVRAHKSLAVEDLLTDLRHYCDAEGINFQASLRYANQHYKRRIERQDAQQGVVVVKAAHGAVNKLPDITKNNGFRDAEI